MVDKLFVVQGVANRVWSTEAALDAAMTEAAQLVQSILAAQAELGIAAGTVDASVAKAAAALSTLATARQQIIASHEELNEVKLRLGVRTKLMNEKPKTQSVLPQGGLRQVA